MRAAGFETAIFAPFETCPEDAEGLHLNPLEILPVGTRPQTAPSSPEPGGPGPLAVPEQGPEPDGGALRVDP